MFKKFIENKRLEKKLKEEEKEKDRKNKTFIMTKLDIDEAKRLMTNKFEDPNDYLNIEKNIIIGKIIIFQ